MDLDATTHQPAQLHVMHHAANIKSKTKVRVKWNLRRNWILYVMLVPSLVGLAIFSYGPMYGVLMAFENYSPITGLMHSQFVGLYWFRFIASMPDFTSILYNTVAIAVMKIFFGQLVPICFAILLHEVTSMRFKRSVQTIVYLPHFLSWVIVGGLFIELLGSKGMVNQLLMMFGVHPILFLGDNHWFKFTLVSTDVWKGFGWGTILYLAALTEIDPGLYESAAIDGANRFQKIIHVTLPGIRPMIVLLAALSLGDVLNAGFDQVLIMYNPAVYPSGDIIDTFVYRQGLQEMQFSLSAAVGLFKSVVAFIFIVTSNWMAAKYANYRLF